MALSCGIIGLPMVGKTTFFNLLARTEKETSSFFSGKTATNVNSAVVPDRRLDYLARIYNPRKYTPAVLEVIDVPGLVEGASQGQGAGNQFLSAVREADALIHVVRAFNNDQVLHVDGCVNLIRDLETVVMELLFADLQLIENRIERILGGKKRTKEQEIELAALEKCKGLLEEEKNLAQAELKDEERAALRHVTFLTGKPTVLVINVDEEQLGLKNYPQRDEVMAYAAARDLPVMEICAKAEMEIGQMNREDRDIFMAELGIEEPGIEKLAKSMYARLELISFLTVGEDEVRAWTVRRGTNARAAAGKIHSDLERGFIRAEVVRFEDLEKMGSMAKVKERGLMRLEGKEYIVQDGDIINFRFNV
ncbi:MAG: redox-regulated ATPase YchF [Syntrophomonadaceae bacterium]|nr:redox-regulated ATPase YchF [Syntrophomonadaceae bacterium]